jgi:predicted nuclease of predicted toxin-antitoxin system
MIVVIDENVPVEVADYLRQRGHTVILLRDFHMLGAADREIAALAEERAAVVVTMDRDFKQLVTRVPEGQRRQFRRLGRISLDCKPTSARRRVEQLIRSIEFEHAEAQAGQDRRLIVEITETTYRVIR